MLTARSILSAALLVGTVSTALAQKTGCGQAANALTLGLTAIECLQCTIHVSGDDRWTEYGTEPVVRDVADIDSPVQRGDVIVAIDGMLITTPAGGRRLARPVAGRPSRLTVRRGGRQLMVDLLASETCGRSSEWRVPTERLNWPTTDSSAANDWKYLVDSNGVNHGTKGMAENQRSVYGPFNGIADSIRSSMIRRNTTMGQEKGSGRRMSDSMVQHLGNLLRQYRDTADGRVIWGGRQNDSLYRTPLRRDATAPAPISDGGSPSPRGWLGFGLDCADCTTENGAAGEPIWRFTTSPTIADIDPAGPAELAGILAGDVLRAIDGMQLVSRNGAQRFSTLQPGQRVRLTIIRRSRTMEIPMTVKARRIN